MTVGAVVCGIRRMITPLQSRAARMFLGWEQSELAKKSGLSLSTVSRFENGHAEKRATMALLKQTFEESGIRFIGLTGVDLPVAPPRRAE